MEYQTYTPECHRLHGSFHEDMTSKSENSHLHDVSDENNIQGRLQASKICGEQLDLWTQYIQCHPCCDTQLDDMLNERIYIYYALQRTLGPH